MFLCLNVIFIAVAPDIFAKTFKFYRHECLCTVAVPMDNFENILNIPDLGRHICSLLLHLYEYHLMYVLEISNLISTCIDLFYVLINKFYLILNILHLTGKFHDTFGVCCVILLYNALFWCFHDKYSNLPFFIHSASFWFLSIIFCASVWFIMFCFGVLLIWQNQHIQLPAVVCV